MSEQSDLINLFSKEWEEKCRAVFEKCCYLDKKKIPEEEKWWRIKQLLNELVRPERRRKPRPLKISVEPLVEPEPMRERRKLDFHSPEWMEKCREISEKCAQLEKQNISQAEKLWRTKQLLRDLVMVDKKRRAHAETGGI